MQASGVVSPVGKLLLKVDFLSAMVQAMLMIPVAIWLYRTGARRSPGFGRSGMILGVVGLGGVALLRLAALVDTAVSDILFMVPMGFVGVRLIYAVSHLVSSAWSSISEITERMMRLPSEGLRHQ
jgi:hypothetical protein